MEEDLKKLKEENEKLSKNIAEYEQKATEEVLERLGYTRDLKQELLDILGVTSKRSQDEKDTLSLVNKITQSARENNQELRETGKLENRLIQDRNTFKKLNSEIQLLQRTATQKSIADAENIKKLNQERLKAEDSIAGYQEKVQKSQGATKGGYTTALKSQQALRDSLEEQLKLVIESSDLDTQKLAVLLQYSDELEKMIKSRENEVENQDKVNSAMGVTGALLSNINKIGIRAFGGLGLNLGAFGVELDKATQAGKDMAESLALSEEGKGLSDFDKRVRTMQATFPGVRKAVKSAFNDPLTIAVTLFSTIYQSALAINKESVELSRLIGNVNTTTAAFNSRMASTVDVLKVVNELTQQVGLNAQAIFSPTTLAAAAEFKNMLGLSGTEAGNLAMISEVTNKSLDSSAKQIVNQVNNFNRANRSAVAQGVILRDVGNASDSITASLGAQPGLIAAAASSARRLGIELKELDNIANSLLDFESSIEAELEAQLLTGRQINLSKARELALSNDLAGVGEELFKNSASLAEFGSMNRIQQEAQAKALGLTRDQLARTAYIRALEVGMTEEQAALATNVSLEEMKRLSIQESISKSIEKITQQLAAPLEIIASLASNAFVFYGALTLIAGIGLGKLILSFASMSAMLATSAASAITLTSALTLGLGAAAIIGAIIAITAALKSSRESAMPKVQDAVISPDGGLVVSGPKGSIQLDKNDSIIAGTNLNAGNTDVSETNRLLRELISTVGRGGHVYIDGNKAGQALVLASSKS